MTVPGGKMRRRPPPARREVLFRDDAADNDHRFPQASLAQRAFQRRREREVACGERGDADDMRFGLCRERRHLVRRRE